MCDVWRRSQLTRSAYRFGLSFFIRFVDIAIPLVFVFMFRLALYDLFTLPRFARCELKLALKNHSLSHAINCSLVASRNKNNRNLLNEEPIDCFRMENRHLQANPLRLHSTTFDLLCIVLCVRVSLSIAQRALFLDTSHFRFYCQTKLKILIETKQLKPFNLAVGLRVNSCKLGSDF